MDIELFSPFIKKYTKEQMAKRLLDSVIRHCQSQFLKMGRQIHIYSKDSAQPKTSLPSYKMELIVADTTFDNKRFTGVHSVMVRGKFYEEEIPKGDIKGWMKGGGGSYSRMPSIGGAEGAVPATTTEDGAIESFFLWAKIESWITISWIMPLSLTERIPARNIFAKDELDRLESFSEMVVNIESKKNNSDVDRLITLINNGFFMKQWRESIRRSLSKGRNQFNYYLTTDSFGYSGPTVTGHPIVLKLAIESTGEKDYQIRLEFDEQLYSLKTFFGTPVKERIIPISAADLRKAPSKVNNEMMRFIEIFVNSNTR